MSYFAGSSPPFLGRERAAVDVDVVNIVGPERRSPRYHETGLALKIECMFRLVKRCDVMFILKSQKTC